MRRDMLIATTFLSAFTFMLFIGHKGVEFEKERVSQNNLKTSKNNMQIRARKSELEKQNRKFSNSIRKSDKQNDR